MPGTAAGGVPQPAGFRDSDYDDTVPDQLQGATRVSAREVRQLQALQSAVLVDVVPQIRQPGSIPANQHWLPVPHRGLPGALWLPDVGYGGLSEITEHYFRRHLAKATAGQLDRPLVFYCRMDCWMSWNAAKRALGYGYTSVHWFADGIDDWQFEGFELEVLQPAPGQRHVDTESLDGNGVPARGTDGR